MRTILALLPIVAVVHAADIPKPAIQGLLAYASRAIDKAPEAERGMVAADLARMAAARGLKAEAIALMDKARAEAKKPGAKSADDTLATVLAAEESLDLPDWKLHQDTYVLEADNSAVAASNLAYARILAGGDRGDMKQIEAAVEMDRLKRDSIALRTALESFAKRSDSERFSQTYDLMKKYKLDKYDVWTLGSILVGAGVPSVADKTLEKLTGEDRQGAAYYLIEGAAQAGNPDLAQKMQKELGTDREAYGHAMVALAFARKKNVEEAKKSALRADIVNAGNDSKPYVDRILVDAEVFYALPEAEKRLSRMPAGVPRDFASGTVALAYVLRADQTSTQRVLDLDPKATASVVFRLLAAALDRA